MENDARPVPFDMRELVVLHWNGLLAVRQSVRYTVPGLSGHSFIAPSASLERSMSLTRQQRAGFCEP